MVRANCKSMSMTDVLIRTVDALFLFCFYLNAAHTDLQKNIADPLDLFVESSFPELY